MARRSASLFASVVGGVVLVAACSSGPSPEALAADRRPAATTTTIPLAAGLFKIDISNGAFQPAVVELDLDEFQIVRWQNTDDREYVIVSRTRGLFESPPLAKGDIFEVDFTTLDVDVHRYFMEIGNQIVPGLIDTRPQQ
ncbi:MAG: hypothetical protein OEM22_04420 [Acidimicrobiia bacterium]|nr:hypothetical protein [Acidimicrobiia bacterium]